MVQDYYWVYCVEKHSRRLGTAGGSLRRDRRHHFFLRKKERKLPSESALDLGEAEERNLGDAAWQN
jgi:hypothetical protein